MNNKTRLDTITSILQLLKPRLSEQYHITRIGIFGSVTKGTQTDDSDVDLLVEFSDPPGLFRFMEIEAFLSDTLQTRVDLVDAEGIKPRLKNRILSEVKYV
ncbi:nucleotidyltransferase family protein [Methanospirillum sp.]|uniref:nucleotidyltransferase family protein n=1 Tax=Methanospirillum sp. TaxID=45200 RepID=UPI00260646E1|nr:nucleotidyltransferase family protein [Methanospirillum sp.]